MILVEDINNFPVVTVGRKIRYNNLFPSGTNVNFIGNIDAKERRAEIRTYERGVEDETLACGTGSTACGILLVLLGIFDKPPISLITRIKE